MSTTICFCKNISNHEIEKAILKGAKTLNDIQQMTGACNGNSCDNLNPKGVCCSSEINKMLKKGNSTYSKCSCCQ